MNEILDQHRNDLIEEAKKALKNPYAKDYGRIFSAAVLTKQGNIYSAISYFSDTYSLTLHGEQAALCHAACHGEGDIVAMVITSNEELKPDEFTNPCHMCKQLMWESQMRSGVKMVVILINSSDQTKEIALDEMMAFPWPKGKE